MVNKCRRKFAGVVGILFSGLSGCILSEDNEPVKICRLGGVSQIPREGTISVRIEADEDGILFADEIRNDPDGDTEISLSDRMPVESTDPSSTLIVEFDGQSSSFGINEADYSEINVLLELYQIDGEVSIAIYTGEGDC